MSSLVYKKTDAGAVFLQSEVDEGATLLEEVLRRKETYSGGAFSAEKKEAHEGNNYKRRASVNPRMVSLLKKNDGEEADASDEEEEEEGDEAKELPPAPVSKVSSVSAVQRNVRKSIFSSMTEKEKLCADIKKQLPPAPSPNKGLFTTEGGKDQGYAWLFLGFGTSWILNAFGVPIFFCILSACYFVFKFLRVNMDRSWAWEYWLACGHLYVKEVSSRGVHKLPKDQPWILCGGPHNNAMFDPLLTTMVTRSRHRMPPGYGCAASLYKQQPQKWIFESMEAIPVTRPQDLATAQPGKIWIEPVPILDEDGKKSGEKETIKGDEKADFSKILLPATCFFKGGASAAVEQVLDDKTMTLKTSILEGIMKLNKDQTMSREDVAKEPRGFKSLQNKKGQADGFLDANIERLERGGPIGIMPEGGSHDQPKFLDFKPGVAMVALEHASRHGTGLVPIAPYVMNYFNSTSFRCRAFVDFGDLIYVTDEQVEMWRNRDTKREAVAEVMDQVRKTMGDLALQTRSYDDHNFFNALRRLYTNADVTDCQKQSMAKAFARHYDGYKKHPDIIELRTKVEKYMEMLKDYGIHDFMVQKNFTAGFERDMVGTFVKRACLLLVLSLLYIPVMVLQAPMVLTANWMAEKARKKALAGSDVKLTGKDLVPPTKVGVAAIMTPLLHIIYSVICYRFLDEGDMFLQTPPKYSLIYFFFGPVGFYMSLMNSEGIVRLGRSCVALWYVIIGNPITEKLCALRAECVSLTADAVDDLGFGNEETKEDEESQMKFGKKKTNVLRYFFNDDDIVQQSYK